MLTNLTLSVFCSHYRILLERAEFIHLFLCSYIEYKKRYLINIFNTNLTQFNTVEIWKCLIEFTLHSRQWWVCNFLGKWRAKLGISRLLIAYDRRVTMCLAYDMLCGNFMCLHQRLPCFHTQQHSSASIIEYFPNLNACFSSTVIHYSTPHILILPYGPLWNYLSRKWLDVACRNCSSHGHVRRHNLKTFTQIFTIRIILR